MHHLASSTWWHLQENKQQKWRREEENGGGKKKSNKEKDGDGKRLFIITIGKSSYFFFLFSILCLIDFPSTKRERERGDIYVSTRNNIHGLWHMNEIDRLLHPKLRPTIKLFGEIKTRYYFNKLRQLMKIDSIAMIEHINEYDIWVNQK